MMTETETERPFDPELPTRARSYLEAWKRLPHPSPRDNEISAFFDGAGHHAITEDDLEQLLDRLDFRAKEAQQLAEKCAAYRCRIAELEAELGGFETAWGVRYGIAKTMDSDAEPDTYTTERESEVDARQWRDEYAPHGVIVTCQFSPWLAVDEAAVAESAGE